MGSLSDVSFFMFANYAGAWLHMSEFPDATNFNFDSSFFLKGFF